MRSTISIMSPITADVRHRNDDLIQILQSHRFDGGAAWLIADEIAKVVDRLHPQESKHARFELSKNHARATFPMSPASIFKSPCGLEKIHRPIDLWFLGLFLVCVIGASLCYPFDVIGRDLGLGFFISIPIAPLGWVIYRWWACKILSEKFESNCGVHFTPTGSMFINPDLGIMELRRTVAHELGHCYFTIESHLQETLGELRAIEEGDFDIRTDPLMHSQDPLSSAELQKLRTWCSDRYGPGRPLKLFEKEPNWTYHYGRYVGQRILHTTGGDYKKAYSRLIDLNKIKYPRPAKTRLARRG